MSTQPNSPKFPDWFVTDCPPEDATEASGTIYRFVEHIPIDAKEFLSYHETGERPQGRPCERCGLSVFRKVDDVRRLLRHLWKSYPGKKYGPNIVRRELAEADGKTKQTGGNGHHTWWAYEGVKRHDSFVFVETLLKNGK